MIITTNNYLVEYGNSIRFRVQFYDYDDSTKIDPEVVKFIIYDDCYNILEETTLDSTSRISIGLYQYTYVVPKAFCDKRIFYEFYGEIDGEPRLKRGSLQVRFME